MIRRLAPDTRVFSADDLALGYGSTATNITYIGDLVRKTVDEMLRIPNFGRKSVNEILEVLKPMGLSLGIEVPDWPPEDIDALAARFEAESAE